MHSRFKYSLILMFLLNFLMVCAVFVYPVSATPCAVLTVSLPEGVYRGYDGDPWLCECWFLNLTGAVQTFIVRINNTSGSLRSYDTRLVIALNDAGYNNLVSLVVNGTSVPKSAFNWGTPKPYNKWTWPSGDVYPTWFNDNCINVGLIPKKSYKTLVVSVTFSDPTGVRMHFDAYGKSTSGSVTWDGQIVHNPLSADSTVFLQAGPTPPQPPFAVFTFTPTYPEVNGLVTFDASGSYDPDGYIVSYTWNFGDDTPPVVENDPVTQHAYTSFGDYTVTLTVTDNDSLTDQETASVHVSQHPVAVFTFLPPDPLVHEVVTFDASDSSPDGGEIIAYTWNFGDGNITTTDNPIITHAYETYGTFTVTLNVTDSEGKWDIESKQITVENAPIADFGWDPYYPQRDEPVTFDASASTPDGGIIVSYAWDFGDGTPIVEESYPITTHVYATAGDYIVTLNVTDSEGRWDTETKTVTVVPKRYSVTFTQTGLTSDASGTVVTVKGAPLTYSSLPYNIYVDENTVITYSYESIVLSTISGKRFALVSVTGPSSPITVTSDITVTGNYKTQYYLEVSSAYGSPSPTSGWYDAGSSITASVNSPVSGPAGTRYVCTGWTGTGSAPSSGMGTSVTFTLNTPSSITWNWKAQYLLTVVTDPAGLSPQPTRNPEGEAGPANSWWYDADTSVTLTAQTVAGYNFNYWDVNGASQGSGVNPITVVMNAPKTATAHYTAQVITYTLKIETTVGGTTNPAPGTYTYAAGSLVQVNAIPSGGYVFDHWELNGTNVGTATTYTVTMNANYVLKAFFKAAPTPPTVSINPMTASIMVGQQVTFMSTVSGGTPPYHYQWYLNGNPVSGAISESWAFTPTAIGTYYVVLKVTDDAGNIGQSEPAKVTVSAVPVGGYSVSLAKSASITPIIAYTLLTVLFGLLLSMAKRKRK